jgi:hypothetical protein
MAEDVITQTLADQLLMDPLGQPLAYSTTIWMRRRDKQDEKA